jgi:hypothetical protein
MIRRYFHALLVCSGLLLCFLPSCKSGSSAGADAGGRLPDGGVVPTGDGGSVDAGDGKCHSNAACTATRYCDLASGGCVPAKPCQANASAGDPSGVNGCEYQADDTNPDYCANGSCYCNLKQGVCLPRVAKCAACDNDVECGNDPIIYQDYVASCVDFAPSPGGSGAKACLPTPPSNQACPPGYSRGSGTYAADCIPAGGACGAAGACSKDSDCDPVSANPICEVSPRGICVAACTFNHKDGSSDCPPNQVCHVDPRLLTPGSNPNLGLGRCEAPCDAATGAYACPTGLACVSDSLNGQKRCRPPPPECIRDVDCPPNTDAHTTGSCNLNTLACQTSCAKDSQCVVGYSCQSGVCNKKSCIDEGGAIFACSRGQFCCGEAGGPSCPAGVAQGLCYDAPNPPWCATCGADGFLKAADDLARPQAPFCAGMKEWISCDPVSMTPIAQCPVEYKCSIGPQFCQADSDCGSSGKCGDIQMMMGMTTIKTKGCTCADATQTCPTGVSTCGKDAMGKSTGICVSHWCDMQFCFGAMIP